MLVPLREKLRNIPKLAVLIVGLIVLASAARVVLYGDPRLSISGNDTESYVTSSRVPLFSSEIMTGRRLLSTNLFYKFLEPAQGYEITINGSISTVRRGFQPGFERIVIAQLILSLLGWGYLAYVFAEHLHHPLTKILGTGFVLLFAFTPQMADWDSILMSESLTFSLFALQLALLINMGFAIYKDPNAKITGQVIVWAAIFFFWVFLRDTNLFTALVYIGMLAGVLFAARYRGNKTITRTALFLGAVFLLGLITSSQSVRSHVQIINIYKDDLLSSPSRTAILQEWGMPPPLTPEYDVWFKENSTKTLARFMLTHPGYPLLKILNDFPIAFREIKQTYFKAPDLDPAREQLMHIGDALHPENTTPFLASFLLLTGLLMSAKNNPDKRRVWAWIGALLFLTASVTMIPTILGDTWAINRHALFSTMIYRLMMWILACIMIDLTLQKPEQ